MRKIILNLAVSLDWYIEWTKWEFDWCLTDQDYWMEVFSKSIDTMLIWRKSYQLFWDDMKKFFPNCEQVVFSTTLKDKNIKIISYDLFKNINKIKETPWKDIWLFWWAKLIKSLLDLKLIDEINILIHPLVLWGWTPLFLWSDDRIKLELLSSKSFSSWAIQTHYKILY